MKKGLAVEGKALVGIGWSQLVPVKRVNRA